MDVFEGDSRARNMRPLPWVGDPERWGGAGSTTLSLSPGAPVRFDGPVIFRAQCQDLLAVGWDLLASWQTQGLQTGNDTLTVIMAVTAGIGQATSSLIWQCGTLDPAGATPNPQAVALGWLGSPDPDRCGVALSGQPIIANALSARWTVIAETVGLAHDVAFQITAHCAPRAWAP